MFYTAHWTVQTVLSTYLAYLRGKCWCTTLPNNFQRGTSKQLPWPPWQEQPQESYITMTEYDCRNMCVFSFCFCLDNIRVTVTVWRLRGNIIRTALCWVVWHNVHSQQHTRMSSSYRSSRLGLSHWDPYTMRRGGCLELYYCNMVEWSWWDLSLIWQTNWFPSVLWHCWFGIYDL